jgi:hypothetical protein
MISERSGYMEKLISGMGTDQVKIGALVTTESTL